MRQTREEDGLQHNMPEAYDGRYADINFVFSYLSDGRLQWYGEVIEAFVEKSGIDLTGKRIADVGCGLGNALRYIYNNYDPGELFGFDFSKAALEWARQVLPEAKFKVHDLDNPLKGKYDVIMALEVFEHLCNPELVLQNLLDSLNDGGMLFVTVPDGKTDGWFGHINFWTMSELEEFFGTKHVGQLDDILLGVVIKEQAILRRIK